MSPLNNGQPSNIRPSKTSPTHMNSTLVQNSAQNTQHFTSQGAQSSYASTGTTEPQMYLENYSHEENSHHQQLNNFQPQSNITNGSIQKSQETICQASLISKFETVGNSPYNKISFPTQSEIGSQPQPHYSHSINRSQTSSQHSSHQSSSGSLYENGTRGTFDQSNLYNSANNNTLSSNIDSHHSNSMFSTSVPVTISSYGNKQTNTTYSPYESTSSIPSHHGHSLSLDSTTASSTYSSSRSLVDESTRKHHRQTSSISSTLSINYDNKLVDLARQNIHTNLTELALSIKLTGQRLSTMLGTNTKNSKENRVAENQKKRQHQLFALISLLRSIRLDENSVCPRNIIFGRYVNNCKKHDLRPICNASFGKLVKMLYPNVKTRRLGIRGASRYHYCGLQLIPNDDFDDESLFDNSSSVNDNNSVAPSSSNISVKPEFDINFEDKPDVDLDHDNNQGDTYTYPKISFDDDLFTHFDDKISQFIPVISNLSDLENKPSHREIVNLYYQFSMRIFQNLRYMKIKTLFNELATFGFNENTLSSNAIKVFSTDYTELIPLLIKCDLELYRSCIRLVSKIIFQDVPEHVRYQISNIDSRFIVSIKGMQLPQPLIDAKVKLATKFVNLLTRLSKVVSLASNFSSKLAKITNVETFLEEWFKLNIDKLIDNSFLIPEEKKVEVKSFMKNDLTTTFQNLISDFKLHESDNTGFSLENDDDKSKENTIVHSLAVLFATVPPKFKQTKPRNLLLHISSIISEIMRELTLEEVTVNFSIWWSLSCWVNEYFSFLAELGGFLK